MPRRRYTGTGLAAASAPTLRVGNGTGLRVRLTLPACKSDLRHGDHQAIVQLRLCDCLMVTQIALVCLSQIDGSWLVACLWITRTALVMREYGMNICKSDRFKLRSPGPSHLTRIGSPSPGRRSEARISLPLGVRATSRVR
jgi:hypothetical protein